MRSGRIRLTSLLLLAALVVAGAWAWTFGPYYWDFMVMKEVTKSTVLEWDGLGEAKARSRLDQLLNKRGLADYIYPSDCLFEPRGEIKRLRCQWAVEVSWPLVDRWETLSFDLVTEIDAHGNVEQWRASPGEE